MSDKIVRVDIDEEWAKAAELDKAKRELEELKRRYGLREPDRGTTMNDKGVKWRSTPPDYTIANLAYLKGKTMSHSEGSLEEIVENAVKTWEFEASHKMDISQWTSVNKDLYHVSVNGGQIVSGEDAKNRGNYSWLLQGCPARLWDNKKMNFDASHHLFRTAFNSGFPWEVISVFAGPPVIVFSWRHWATFGGVYKCPVTGIENQGKGELIELFGMGRITVDKDLKVCGIEIFYKPDEFLEVMQGVRDPAELCKGTALVGPGCDMKESSGGIPWSRIAIVVLLAVCVVFVYLYFTK